MDLRFKALRADGFGVEGDLRFWDVGLRALGIRGPHGLWV